MCLWLFSCAACLVSASPPPWLAQRQCAYTEESWATPSVEASRGQRAMCLCLAVLRHSPCARSCKNVVWGWGRVHVCVARMCAARMGASLAGTPAARLWGPQCIVSWIGCETFVHTWHLVIGRPCAMVKRTPTKRANKNAGVSGTTPTKSSQGAPPQDKSQIEGSSGLAKRVGRIKAQSIMPVYMRRGAQCARAHHRPSRVEQSLGPTCMERH